jgi:peptide/nickel transport system permease protein
VRAITRLDYPAIMGSSLLITLAFILINLVVDMLYGVLDPRIRY